MKATGIVRRIDDLGRIVIPKEIRRTLKIREGDPLEIFIQKDGEIIFKKYSPIGEMGNFVKEYAESLAQTSGLTACIVDKDQVIAISGGSKKDFLKKEISRDLEKAIDERTTVMATKSDSHYVPLLQNGVDDKYSSQLITPIISEGDAIGAVIFLSNDAKSKIGEVEEKLAQSAAGFLGRQMEQ